MPQPPRITVLGSLNMDISVTVSRLAGPGETVLGSAARLQPGGKGANQAVAAARLGASVRMAGCCGDDAFGRELRSALEAAGVDITAVRVLAGVPSGLALITVDATGENSITVAPGANGLAGPPEAAASVAAAASAAAPCDALILSAEIPVPVLADALDRARAAQVMTVLNLAPAPPDASGLLGAGVDWLIVNAPEAGAILGRPWPIRPGPRPPRPTWLGRGRPRRDHPGAGRGGPGRFRCRAGGRGPCPGSACAAWTASGRATLSSPRSAWRWRRERPRRRRSGSPVRSAPRP